MKISSLLLEGSCAPAYSSPEIMSPLWLYKKPNWVSWKSLCRTLPPAMMITRKKKKKERPVICLQNMKPITYKLLLIIYWDKYRIIISTSLGNRQALKNLLVSLRFGWYKTINHCACVLPSKVLKENDCRIANTELLALGMTATLFSSPLSVPLRRGDQCKVCRNVVDLLQSTSPVLFTTLPHQLSFRQLSLPSSSKVQSLILVDLRTSLPNSSLEELKIASRAEVGEKFV